MKKTTTVLVSTPRVNNIAIAAFFVAMVFGPTNIVRAQASKNGGDDLAARAAELFEAERFAEAYPLYSQLVSLKPNDPDYNFRFGTTSLYTNVPKETAIKHLSFALKKGCSDVRVYFYLGKAYHLNYEFAKASDAYKSYLAKVSPKEKKVLPAAMQLRMCSQGERLLANIRDVVVLEKTRANVDDFFRYYNLEEIGGRVLRTPDALLSKYDQKMGLVSVIHYPGNAITIYFTSYGKDGKTGKDLYRADLLAGGEFSTPERLSDVINTPEDEDFAFMHPDGKSFYFASRGHNSMGGYDIFKSTYDRNTDTFSQPVNLDFAINTPDDDLFYVVDSLGQSAYFASGRNSSQGELNVYKVLVKSLPVNLMFIAGTYKPDAPGVDVHAKITISDELTGKPIFETTADATANGYLLELPKSGQYKIDVLPKGGAVRHSGVFTVPVYDESVALAQELRIVNENGVEKLIITNRFEEPLNINLAELAADALRRRAGLDVNATEERLKEIEAAEEEENTLREAIKEEDLLVLAGFDRSMQLPVVQQEIADWAEEQATIETRAKQHAARLINEATIAQSEAAKGMKSAEAIMQGVNKDDAERYVAALTEYNKVLNEAKKQQRIADNALAAARRLHSASDELSAATSRRQAENTQLTNHLEKGELELAVAVLTNHYQAKKNGEHPQLPAAAAIELAITEQSRATDAVKRRIDGLEEERAALATKLKQGQRELDAATKKNVRTQLELDLERLEDEILTIDNELLDRRQILLKYNQEQQNLIVQKQILTEVGQQDVTVAYTAYDPSVAETLSAQLESSRERLNLLEIDDDETLALIDPDAERRRVALELLPTLGAKAIEMNLEMKPVTGLRNEYSATLSALNERGISPDAQTAALRNIELKRVDAQIGFLQSVDLKQLTNDELAYRERELIEALDYRNELVGSKQTVATLPPLAPNLAEKALRERYPAYESVAEAASSKGNDLALWQQRIQEINATQKQIDADIEAVNMAIVASDDAAEVESLTNEHEQLLQLKAHLASETSLQQLQMAWENDQRAIIEDDVNFRLKTEQQIELASTYISTLEQVLEGLNRSVQPNLSEVKRVNDQLELAKTKLANYQSDLALGLSVSAPVEDQSSEVNSTTRDAATKAISNIDVQSLSVSELQDELDDLTAVIDNPNREGERDRAQARMTKIDGEISRRNSDRIAEIETSIEVVNVFELSALRPDELAVYKTIDGALRTDEAYQKAQQTIEQKDAEIERVDESLENETSVGKLKKLDRDRESLYADRAEAEVNRSLIVTTFISNEYNRQQEAIRVAWEQSDINSDHRNLLGTHLAVEQRKAEQAIEEASVLRQEHAKERDVIKKGAGMNEALSLELAALAVQERLIALIENGDQLSTLSSGQLAQVLSGELLLSDALNVQTATRVDQIQPLSENLDVAPVTSTDDQQSVDANETTAQDASAENVSSVAQPEQIIAEDTIELNETDPIVDTVEPEATVELSEAEIRVAELRNERKALPQIISAIDLQPTLSQEVLTSQALISEITEEEDIAPEVISEIYNSEAFVQYEAATTGLNALIAERQSLATIRNAAASDFAKVNERIAKLEQALLVSSNLAEQEGLESEIRTLYRNAEVRYEEVREAEERLAAKDAEIEERAAEVRDLRREVSEASALRITKAISEPTAETVAPAFESTSSSAMGEVRSEAGKSDLSRYFFALPEVLIESVFSFTDQAIYSTSEPIPLDLPMPTGVVYKVQVGAFRNPIPQDHFNRFAPLAGERLDNGITRYTAGIFVDFGSADDAKRSIRELGYSDAFVVAYRDGKRISIDAAKLEEGAVASFEDTSNSGSNTAEGPSTANRSSEGETAVSTESSTTTVNDGEVKEGTTSPSRGNAETPKTTPREVTLPSFAGDWSERKGTYYTVQVGVYSRPVSLTDLYNVSEVMAEVLTNGMVRYTTGVYGDIESAQVRKDEARTAGIQDAFVTAYVDGVRVPIGTITSSPIQNPVPNQTEESEVSSTYQVQIGGFIGQVPSNTARALLMLESTWGIYQVKRGEETVYLTRKFATKVEAEKAMESFKEQGASKISVVEK